MPHYLYMKIVPNPRLLSPGVHTHIRRGKKYVPFELLGIEKKLSLNILL